MILWLKFYFYQRWLDLKLVIDGFVSLLLFIVLTSADSAEMSAFFSISFFVSFLCWQR